LAKKIGAVEFFECSSKENINIENIFESAVGTMMKISTDDKVLMDVPEDEETSEKLVEISLIPDDEKIEDASEPSLGNLCTLLSCAKFKFLK
jgi:hypothetical protein